MMLNTSGFAVFIGGRLFTRMRRIPCDCFGGLSEWVERTAPWLIPALGMVTLTNLLLSLFYKPLPIETPAIKLALCVLLSIVVILSWRGQLRVSKPRTASNPSPVTNISIKATELAELLHPKDLSGTETEAPRGLEDRDQVHLIFVSHHCTSCTTLISRLASHAGAELVRNLVVVVDDANFPIAEPLTSSVDKDARLARRFGIRLTPTLVCLMFEEGMYKGERMEGNLPILVKMFGLEDMFTLKKAA